MSGKPFHNLCVQMLAGADQIDHRRVPARFDEAQARMRDAIARLEAAGVPHLTLVAAMLSEMIPRMVRENGPEWAAYSRILPRTFAPVQFKAAHDSNLDLAE